MATDLQHNNLIVKVLDGNKHVKHVLTTEEVKKLTMIEGRFPLTKLPVCNHCEKLGLWDRDRLTNKIIGRCKSCGSISYNPITYATYLTQNLDVDATGETFRKTLFVDRKIDSYKRMVYLPDFTRLDGGKNGNI